MSRHETDRATQCFLKPNFREFGTNFMEPPQETELWARLGPPAVSWTLRSNCFPLLTPVLTVNSVRTFKAGRNSAWPQPQNQMSARPSTGFPDSQWTRHVKPQFPQQLASVHPTHTWTHPVLGAEPLLCPTDVPSVILGDFSQCSAHRSWLKSYQSQMKANS